MMDEMKVDEMKEGAPSIELVIAGEPIPAGSYRPIPIRKAGVLVGSRVTNDNPRTKLWQKIVRGVALEVMQKEFGVQCEPFKGPLCLRSYFWFARPKSHFCTGKRAGVLKPSAPIHKTTKPDTSKLIRAVEDALTGVVYEDDAQIVVNRAYKGFGPPHCRLVVSQVLERV